ncbi:hypothetical protein HK101_007697 [Irineochytrium annulatum]|nr:hypothetical protein HK101_007697 [Irineochytrium annulatum]
MHALSNLVLLLAVAASAVVASPARVRSADAAPSKDGGFPRGGESDVKKLNAFAAEDFKIDLNNNPHKASTDGGTVSKMKIDTMAALEGQDIALTYTTLKPCGAADPNVHSRASEILFLISGSMKVGFMYENDGNVNVNILHPGEAMLIPHGSLHFVVNDNCEDAVFTGSFNNDDPGHLTLPEAMFKLPDDILESAFGTSANDVPVMRDANPPNPSTGTEACMQKCFGGSGTPGSYGSPGGSKYRRASH